MATVKRILVVDDEENARYGLGLLLHQAGFEVFSAADAYQALEELNCRRIHMVLSDVCMPGMNGMSFLQEIVEQHPDTGVILMTADAGYEAYQKAITLGAIDYINKPLVFEELMELMRRYFQTH